MHEARGRSGRPQRGDRRRSPRRTNRSATRTAPASNEDGLPNDPIATARQIGANEDGRSAARMSGVREDASRNVESAESRPASWIATSRLTLQSSMPVHRRLSMISSSASRARPDALERQAGQRLVDDVQLREEVVAIRLDVDQAGRELAAARRLVQPLQRADLVGRVVALPRASSDTASTRRASSLPASCPARSRR